MKQLLLALVAPLLACGDSTGAKVAVARIVLTASDTALAVTDTSTLNVVAYDAGGQVLAPADGSQTIDHATFTVQPSGSLEISDAHAIALATGPARLTAAVDGFSSTVSFTVAGIAHRADITANQTWHAADNPHFVRRAIHVGPGAVTLTLEPGTQVRFSVAAGLVFDGAQAALKAMGTSASPISLTADSAAVNQANPIKGFWSGVLLSSSQSELHYVVMSDCARDTYLATPYFGACLVLADLSHQDPRPLLQNVTIKDFGITGLLAQDGAGLDPGSANLVIAGGGPFYFGGGGLPIFINANEAGTIPATTTLSGNLDNRIRVGTQVGLGDSVVRDGQTWHNLGVPYFVPNTIMVGGPNVPVLTLAAGIELQFDRFTGLSVGTTASGGLVAAGTAAAPVLFTSPDAAPLKYPDSWNGVVFGDSAVAGSKLDYAIVEVGGGFNATFPWNGEVVVRPNGLAALITNSTIRRSGYCGVLRAWMPAPANTDYTDTTLHNSFAQNATGDQCGP